MGAPTDPWPRERRLWPLLVGFLVAVLLLCGAPAIGGLIYFRNRPVQADPGVPVLDTAMVDRLARPGLTEADLTSVNITDAFFAYVIRTAQQPQSVLTTEVARGKDAAAADAGNKEYFKVGFDYRTKAVVFAWDNHYGPYVSQNRCYGATQASRSTATEPFAEKPVAPEAPCQLGKVVNYYLSDGFTPGGLTINQAQLYARFLHDQDGLIRVRSLALADHKGRQYLHFTVDLVPVTGERGGKVYLGNTWLLTAFGKTGLDAAAQPFNYRGAGTEGLHLEYYIDPPGKLFSYSEITSAPGKDETGVEKPVETFQKTRVRYAYDSATFDATPRNGDPIAIDW